MPAASAQLTTFIAPFTEARSRTETKSGTGFFTLVAQAFMEARQRQAEREVARLIENGGGRLTDSLERQIERHFV